MKEKILGCLEICLFMKKGLARFDPSIKSMVLSFIFPVITFPIGIFLSRYNPEFADKSIQSLIVHDLLYTIGMTVVIIGAMSGIAKHFNKMDELPRWITIGNWMIVPAFILMLFPLVTLATGYHSWGEVYPILLVIMLYQTACDGFIATFVMRMSWYFGAAFALFTLVIADAITKLFL